MKRRTFLAISAAGAAASVARAGGVRAAHMLAAPPMEAGWRTFDIVTEVDLWPQDLPARLWLPLPLYEDTTYLRVVDYRFAGNAGVTGVYRDPTFGAPAFFAQWSDRTASPRLALTTRIATRNRHVDLGRPGSAAAVSAERLRFICSPPRISPPMASCARRRSASCRSLRARRCSARGR